MVKSKSTSQPKYEEMDQYDFGDVDSSMDKNYEKYAPYIGGFLIDFSGLEHDLDRAIAELIFERAHEKGYIIIKNLTMDEKIELYKDLLMPMVQHGGGRKKQLVEKVKKVIGRLKSINTLRNRIAHAKWNTLDKDGYVRVKVESKEGLTRYKSEHVTPKIMSQGITEMGRLAKLVNDLPQKAWDNLKKIPSKRASNKKRTK